MSKGRVFQDQKLVYEDAYSQRPIQRLTDYLGHSNHFYFTDACWFNQDRSFVFSSQRENYCNLFRYDLDDDRITQITDLRNRRPLGGYVSAVNNAVYFWNGRQCVELNLETLAERVVWEAVGNMVVRSRPAPTADGKYLVIRLQEEIAEEKAGIAFSYSRFVEFFEKKPLTRIIRVNLLTGLDELVHEDRRYLGHINPSPRAASIITYCHEGPWPRVEQRIWGLNIQTGRTWKIRDQSGQNLAIGHEYWFADGERLGYHGRSRDGQGNHLFGYIKFDNTGCREARFPYHSMHFHSLDEQIMVGDGDPWGRADGKPFIQLFKWDGQQYIGPKILAYHRSTFNDQHAHCHPRFTPDGKAVIYTTDLTSYSNLYLVEIGDFDALPDLS